MGKIIGKRRFAAALCLLAAGNLAAGTSGAAAQEEIQEVESYELAADLVHELDLDETLVWTAWQPFDVMEAADSDTVVFGVGAGEQVALTAVQNAGGRTWVKCRNQDGLEGWFEDPSGLQYREDGNGGLLYGYFGEAHFAG